MGDINILKVEQVSKKFGNQTVLRDVSLNVDRGEIVFLLGPSGCGKTTLLRCVAGFEQPDSGNIYLQSKLLNDLPSHQRGVGMVFQNYALWPHLNVFETVELGLKIKKLSSGERQLKVGRILELAGIAQLSQRYPHQLSGGQQQRVALARALVLEPALVLLDEPLANLDQNIKHELRREIRRLQTELGLAMVYVTHDRNEALALASRIAIMANGTISQVGTARELFDSPISVKAARVLGELNLFNADANGSNQIKTELGVVTLAKAQAGNVQIGFRPDDCILGSAIYNTFDGVVEESEFAGNQEKCRIRIGANLIDAEFDRRTHSEIIVPGCAVKFHIPQDRILVFSGE